jgi:hypothetical protein
MIDDEGLRRALEARVGDTQIRLTERARTIALAHPRSAAGLRSKVRRWGRTAAAGAAVAAMTMVVVAALNLRSLAPEPATTPTASPAPARTGGPSTGPTLSIAPIVPFEAWGSVTWTAGDDALFDVPGHNTFVQSALDWQGRWVAVGYRLDLTTHAVVGCIWTSTDGLTWALDDGWPGVQFDRLVATPERLAIVGAHRAPDDGDVPGDSRASMWVSTDAADWTEAPLPDQGSDYSFVALAAAGEIGWLVQVGTIEGDQRWLAGDPVGGWEELPVDGSAFLGAQVSGLVGMPDGWLAIGMTGADPDQDPSDDRMAIWSSTDGRRWTAAGVERPGTSVGSVVQVAGGWVATGHDHGGCSRCIGGARLLWRSDDGSRWAPVDLDLANANGFGGTIVASDGRRAVLFDTDAEGRLRLRESGDGRAWTDIDVFADASVGAQGILGGGTVAIGPDSILTFVDPSVRSEDYFWMVPRIATAGPPPADAATQPPAPTPHDTVCQPANQECGS